MNVSIPRQYCPVCVERAVQRLIWGPRKGRDLYLFLDLTPFNSAPLPEGGGWGRDLCTLPCHSSCELFLLCN